MLALFSIGSSKLGRIMRLVVIGAVALGVVGIGGSVWANPPDGKGNHNHGGGGGGGGDDGGGGGPAGTIYFATGFSFGGPLNTMDGDGANKAPLPGDVHGDPSHALHGDQRWYLEVQFITGEFYPDGDERRELFAVTEAGGTVQLTDQADLEPMPSVTFGATRWTPDDAFVSWVGLRWDPISGMPVDAGVYVAEVAYDATSGDVIGLAAQPIDPMVPTAFVADFSEVWRPVVRTHDWSPDQSAIVYDTVDWELFTADSSTGDSFPLLVGTFVEGWPVWSPNGSKIAFQTGSGAPSIATINPDGSGFKKIIRRTGQAGAGIPAWSPTGEHLIYRWNGSILGDDRADTYRASASGSGKTNLTADIDTRWLRGTPTTPIAWR